MKNSVQKFSSNIIHFCFKNVRRSLVALFVIAGTISVAAFSSSSIAGSLGEWIFGNASLSAPKADTVKGNAESSGEFSSRLSSGSLSVPRNGHTATPIGDGKVLIVGGDAGTFEIFDVAANASIGLGNLTAGRSFHTATLLRDGRVLVIGGFERGQPLVSTEIFEKGAFHAGPNLRVARAGHTATVLGDGRVLIVGGDAKGTVEILDADARGSKIVKAELISPRSFHSAALLKSGDVLFVGGSFEDGSPVLSGEKLNLGSMTFSEVERSLHSPRIRPVLTELPDGKVQIIGGNDEGSMEIFTPDGNYFSAFAHVIPGRAARESSAFKISDAISGQNNGASKAESEVLRTATRAALINNGEASDSLLNRSDYALVKIPESNKVLVFGGKNSDGEILRDFLNLDGSEATITTDQLDYPPNAVVTITGTGFEPHETVQLTLVRDPVFPENPEGLVFYATADENGNFVNDEYKTTEDDLNTSFVLTALGLTSGRTAQTTFTDSSPGSLGNYATSGLSGTTAPTAVSPSNVAANVTFSNLSRGTGLTAVATTNAFNSSSWQTASTLTIAGNTDYYEFTVTPNAGYQFSASELRVGLQRSGTGPSQAELRSSLDSYASTIGSAITVSASLTTSTIDLSSISGLQNQNSAVTFRIYGYSASNTAGTLRIQNVGSPAMVGLEVDGTVSAACTAPSISINPSSATKNVGESVTFSVTASGTATLNYQWRKGGMNISGANSSSYMIPSVVTDDAGSYDVVVTNVCGSATSTAATLTVNKLNQTITFNALPNKTFGDPDFAVSATASSGLTVTFGATGDCTVMGTTVQITGAGSCTITASQAGDATYNAAPDVMQSFNIEKATPTIIWANPADITYGTALGATQLNASASVAGSFVYTPASGTVLNAGNGQNLHADFTPTDTANYNSASKDVSINVLKAGSTTTVTFEAGPYVYRGTAFTATAEVTGVGTTGFTSSVPVVYTGDCTNVTTTDGCTATATYDGDTNHTGSMDAKSITITKAGSTTVVSGGGTYVYNGSPRPASVSVTGAGGLNLTPAPVYSGNCSAAPVNVPDTPCTASYEYAGGDNHFGSSDSTTITITKANQVITFGALDPKFYGEGSITAIATGGGSGNPVTFSTSTPAVCTSGGVNGASIAFVGLGTCTVVASQAGNDNYNAAMDVSRSFLVNPDPTTVVLDTSGHTFINFDCTMNVIKATVTDYVTGVPISGATVTLSIGTQSINAVTNGSGVASGAIVINQPTGSVLAKADYAGSANGIHLPKMVSQSVTIGGSPHVGPGQDADSLYTGSSFYWTTSSTSSTATLTLSATVRDTFEFCPGDITKAKVSFLISTNGGSSFTPVSNAQNLPVGLVNPGDTTVGTASAISQYNIGSSQSMTLTVRVLVGGQYTMSSSTYDELITIGKPGTANSMMGGGVLKNDGIPFFANGYFGLNSVKSNFGSQLVYNKSGKNPQGQVTVTVSSCSRADGTLEPGCTKYTPSLWHSYFIKSNSISEFSLIGGSASFGAKTNVSEILPDGSKVSLDGGNTMQLVFTPSGRPFPPGTSASGSTCTAASGCASIVIFRSSGLGGGVWYSSAWGQPTGSSALKTYMKNVFNGTIAIQ